MRPAFYADLRVKVGAPRRGHLPGAAASDVLALALRRLHGHAKAAGLVFAVAFPLSRSGEQAHPGSVLRLFTETEQTAQSLLAAVSGSQILADALLVYPIRAVPPECAQGVAYLRYRIPSLKSAGHRVEGMHVDGFERRAQRIARGDGFPYLRAHSASTGQSFSIRFEVLPAQTPSADCQPDSYGLAGREHRFALPVLPVDDAPWTPKTRARYEEALG